jgi:DNA-binding response OmpR family regulator
MKLGATTIEPRVKARILIVEDEPILAFVLEEFIAQAGFEIAGVAGRLEAALTIIASGGCDAAVLDANLAGISAGPAAAALVARDVPFIVLSGYSSEQQQGVFSGALFIQKPCQPEHLIKCLRNVLAAHATRGRSGFAAAV